MKREYTAAKIENRKRRRVDEWFRRWTEELRRRQMNAERDRRTKWLLFLLLLVLDSKPVRSFFSLHDPAPAQTPLQAAQPRLRKRNQADDHVGKSPAFDINEHVFFDYSTRPGEEHLHVFDGLTHADIDELNRIHRPHLFSTPAPVPGMPERYAHEPVHIWTLLDHLGSDYHRADAVTALKLLIDESAHDWIHACTCGSEGNSWRDLRLVRQRTPAMTIAEFPRAAARWRDQLRREAEEKVKNRKPDNDDNGLSPK
ncbi:UNVERIFIED_ORG: hypothetical protein J2W85_000777 [Ensifer adhaerens]|nr:hypothetical protein [Ensifer adhaerens]